MDERKILLTLEERLGRLPSLLLPRSLFLRPRFVWLPARNAEQALKAKSNDGDAHQSLQSKDDLVALVNEDAAVYPEQGEVNDKDYSESYDQT